MIRALLLTLFFAAIGMQAQQFYGPILGHVDFREGRVVIQTLREQSVQLRYRDSGSMQAYRFTPAQQTKLSRGFTAEFAIPAEPGRTVEYEVWLDSKSSRGGTFYFRTPQLWRWRTPDPPALRVAFGSCYYANEPRFDRPGKPYGDSATDIFNRIADKNPDLMIWGGDNIYLREPDWGSATGIYARYTHTRAQSGPARLLRSCPNYAIWDDHDFGPNDANSSFIHKDITLRAFHDFWANPSEGLPCQPGITTWFERSDVQVFLLDDRYNRTLPGDSNATILGKAQLEWLKQALLTAPANEWKVVCVGGQFLNTVADFENFARYPKEREALIRHIQDNGIRNVIFLSGDRHFAELSVLKQEGKPTIWDFTSSPLTSGVFARAAEEKNNLRVPGTIYSQDRNFGTLDFSGPRNARTLTMRLFDKQGIQVWEQVVAAEQAKKK
jgi:alkaline phosphatase D